MDESLSPEGKVFTFRSSGWARLLPACFLGVWLCAWAIGESLVLGLLVRGAWAFLGGNAVWPGNKTPPTGAMVAVGLFLMLWLAFWTLGGVAAIREFLRLLWGEDRIVVGGGRLVSLRKRGPFTLRREYLIAEITAIRARLNRTPAIVIDTLSGSRELARTGNHAELQAGVEQIRAACREGGSPLPSREGLPAGWIEAQTLDNGVVLVRDPEKRARQARIVTALAVAALLLEIPLVLGADQRLGLLPPAILGALAFLGLGAGAIWLHLGRMEWRLDRGRLLLCQRFGRTLKTRFEARALALREARDSDGDPSLELLALVEPGRGSLESGTRQGRCTIVREFGDLERAGQLGRWLEGRTGLPFEDLTTPEATARAKEAALARLRTSGPLGRWLVGFLGEHRKP